jgi:anti-sigma B factor antagonist
MEERVEGTLEIERDDGVVTLRGELDMDTVGQLAETLEDIEDIEHTVVLVLAEVSFLDSSGLQAMLKAQKAARERGADVILRRPSPAVCRVLEMTDLVEVFVIEH